MALGHVYIVGAGIRGGLWPVADHREGLTLEAAAIIDQAEIILVDDLVSPAVWAGSEAEIVPVGKRGGRVSTAQVAINQLLVTYAQHGKRVVRLKAGDPGLFGRLWPEIEALQAAAIPFTVVPGLSSALAAPLLAGLCLTEKSQSRQVLICSGHEEQPWSALVAIDTLVFLMASRNLPQICAALMAAGKPPATPVWVVQESGRGRLRGSLAHPPPGHSPCVIVVGDVPHWTPVPQPLANQTVLITRAQASGLRAQLQQLGARVLELPTLVITPPTSYAALDAAIQQRSLYDWLILTSANAVTAFWERLTEAGLDSRALAGIQVAVVGDKTALALQAKGISPDFVPREFVAAALAQELPSTPQRVLFPRVEQGGRDALVQGLQARGAIVDEVAAYDSRCPERADLGIVKALKAGEVNIVTFTSSKTVRYFWQLVQAAGITAADIPTIAAIGPQTAATCIELWGRAEIVAEAYTLEGLVLAIASSQTITKSIGTAL